MRKSARVASKTSSLRKGPTRTAFADLFRAVRRWNRRIVPVLAPIAPETLAFGVRVTRSWTGKLPSFARRSAAIKWIRKRRLRLHQVFDLFWRAPKGFQHRFYRAKIACFQHSVRFFFLFRRHVYLRFRYDDCVVITTTTKGWESSHGTPTIPLRVRWRHTRRRHTTSTTSISHLHHLIVLVVADERHQLFHLRRIHVHHLFRRHVHEPFFRRRFLLRALFVSLFSRFRGGWRRPHWKRWRSAWWRTARRRRHRRRLDSGCRRRKRVLFSFVTCILLFAIFFITNHQHLVILIFFFTG